MEKISFGYIIRKIFPSEPIRQDKWKVQNTSSIPGFSYDHPWFIPGRFMIFYINQLNNFSYHTN